MEESKQDSKQETKREKVFVQPVLKPSARCKYAIDISPGIVRVGRINKRGRMQRFAEASYSLEVKNDINALDDNYVNELAGAIKAASVGVMRGEMVPAHVVTGGSDIITHVFSWPEMPYLALKANAEAEISQYLPESATKYIIAHEVQAKRRQEDGSVVLDTLVTAIPTTEAMAIRIALQRSGFQLIRLDCRENVLCKGVSFYLVGTANNDALESYAVLDLSRPQVSFTVYLNGVYYKSVYFPASAALKEGVSEESIGEIIGYAHDTNYIFNEVENMVYYIMYNERYAGLQCVLVIDPYDVDSVVNKLQQIVEVPVYDMYTRIKRPLIGTIHKIKSISSFLEAFSASILSDQVQPRESLNLAPVVEEPIKTSYTLAGGIAAVLALALVGYFGVVAQLVEQAHLTEQHGALQAELALHVVDEATLAAKEAAVEEAEIELARLEADSEFLEYRDPVYVFLHEHRPPVHVFRYIFETLSAAHFVVLDTVDARGGRVTLSGATGSLTELTAMARDIMRNGHVRVGTLSVGANMETQRGGGEFWYTSFTLTMELEPFQVDGEGATANE